MEDRILMRKILLSMLLMLVILLCGYILDRKVHLKKRSIIIIQALMQWGSSFYLERFIFKPVTSYSVYFFVKFWFLVFCIWLWTFIYNACIDRSIEKNTEFYCVLYGMPVLTCLLGMLLKGNTWTLVGDELNIYNGVVSWNLHLFTYITGMYYAFSYMILPVMKGAVLVKIGIQSLIGGYCIYRAKKHWGSPFVYFIYFLLCSWTVLNQGILGHRMQFYAWLYFFVWIKLFFDYIENRKLDRETECLLLFLMAILSVWRREGVYLTLFAIPLIYVSYRCKLNKEMIKTTILRWVIILTVISLPEASYGFVQSEATTTKISFIVHMMRYGLDQQKYAEELSEIDKIVSIDMINRINADLGDSNFQEVYIGWKDGYVGIRQGYSQEELDIFSNTVKKLIIQEPIIFLHSRWEGFRYVLKNKSLLMSFCGCFILMLYSLFKRNLCFLGLSGCLLVHSAITALFMPASYFKYFYHLYLIGLFWLIVMLIKICMRADNYIEKAIRR